MKKIFLTFLFANFLAFPPPLSAQTAGPLKAADILEMIRAEKPIVIEGQVIEGDLNFNVLGSDINSTIKITNSEIRGVVSVQAVREPQDPKIPSVTFKRKVDFTRTEFAQKVDFTGATFLRGAVFDNSKFKDEALFVETAFKNPASFGGAQFFEVADFARSHFSEDALFFETIFQYPTYFESIEFSGVASFSFAEFQDYASFQACRYFDAVNFIGTKFTTANFGFSEFDNKYTDFSRAEFSGNLTIAGSLFAGFTSFLKMRIDNRTVITNSIFLDQAIFTGASLGRVTFGSIHDHKTSYLASYFLERADFRNAKFNSADFNNVLFKDVDFTRANFDIDLKSSNVNPDAPKFLQQEREEFLAPVEYESDGNMDYLILEDMSFENLKADNRTGMKFIRAVRRLPEQSLRNSEAAADTDASPQSNPGAVTELVESRQEMLRRFEDNFRSNGNVKLTNEAYYQRNTLDRELANRNDFEKLGDLIIADWIAGYGVRPLNPILWSIGFILFFAAIYYFRDIIVIRSTKGKAKLVWQLTEIPIDTAESLADEFTRLDNRGHKRAWDALLFSTSVFIKFGNGRRVAIQGQKTVLAEWALGLVMLAVFFYALSNAVPVFHRLLNATL